MYYRFTEPKAFFFGGKIFYFDHTIRELQEQTPALGMKFSFRLKQRFELTNVICNKQSHVLNFQAETHRVIAPALNVIYSQVHTVNNTRADLHKLNIIRLYLIKTFRGRAHALGKPVRGQRTWSNAWTTYRDNTVLRNFISETRKFIRENTREEKKNYKVVARKYARVKKLNPLTESKKVRKTKSAWF